MRKIIILYPHFPPSNLAGVHRPRLFAKYLPGFGWEPIVLTVDEKYYEERLDYDLVKLLPKNLRIEKVKALRVTKPRIIGDLGLRAYWQLYKKAKDIINNEKIAFLYIPIPSFYCSLLGRMLHTTTGIKYGIDYIDPWVHDFPGSNRIFSRHWFSSKLAQFLEPIAIKRASLITGVAEGYYEAVLSRNPHLVQTAITGAMPYGGDQDDHDILKELNLRPYLFKKRTDKLQLGYAGAMLPNAYAPLEAIFSSIRNNPILFRDVEFHFIGTGKSADDEVGYNIRALAIKYNLWHTNVYEYPKRIPYLDVLVHLQNADGVFILGSTEPHYTPSKAYQGVLSHKPILAVLHKESSAVDALFKSGAAVVLTFEGDKDLGSIETKFAPTFQTFLDFVKLYDPNLTDSKLFEAYSARSVTKMLGALLDKAISTSETK